MILSVALLLFMVFPVAAQNDSLPAYLQMAAQNNPGVRAAFLTYEASLQKEPQAGALADPAIEMGAFLEPMELVGGRQIAQIQLMQMFPWFGTKKAARTEAQHMAQMAWEQFREARDKVYLEVYTQWYALANLQQRVSNTEENLQWLQQLETLAVQRFATGGSAGGSPAPSSGREAAPPATVPGGGGMGGMSMGSAGSGSSPQTAKAMAPVNGGGMQGMEGSPAATGLAEVLRIQLEIATAESDIESLRSEITASKARFNTLLNRPADAEVVVDDDLATLAALPDRETALQQMAAQNPMLAMLREESLAYGAKAVMDKKMGYPMFGIGLQYMLIGRLPEPGMDEMSATNAVNGMNGKDMLMPMVSISLPLYRNKYKAAQKETQLLRQATEAKYADAANTLEAELYRATYELDDAVRKIALYKKQAALARTTGDLLMRAFASGTGSLNDVIQVQRQLLDYRLKESEAVAAYNTRVAAIRKLISSLHSE
jgi:outer membrane protein TolC